MSSPRKNLFKARTFRLLLWINFIILVSTFGLMTIEKWNFQDALYMTVTTLTTIGYGEIHPLSETGRWFNILMILTGVGTLAYSASQIAEDVLEKGLRDLFGANNMKKQIRDLKGHIILCGFGQMGRQVALTLKKRGMPLVVLEKDAEKEAPLRQLEIPFLIGAAENDQLLIEAGIDRASGLITAVTSDAENVFITLTARSLNKTLPIVARAFEESTTPKLLRAGASKVVSPYAHAGIKMASAILNPGVDTFLEVVANEDLLEIQMADLLVGPNSPYVGQSLAEIQKKFTEKNLVIVGVKRLEGGIELAHKTTSAIRNSDRLIVLGDERSLPTNWQNLV